MIFYLFNDTILIEFVLVLYFQKNMNSTLFSPKKSSGNGKFLLYTALAGAGTLASIESVSAQSVTVDSVSTQSTAATTAITSVGAVLVTMAFGLLVFGVVTSVIRRVMGG